jgi:hypothetical protein
MLMQDTVSIAGLEVEGQFFGAVEAVSDDFNALPNSGLLGMAFGTVAQCGKPTFFETLMSKNMVPPMFSVFLARNQESGSEMCFGGIDHSKTLGLIEWIPVISEVCLAMVSSGRQINVLFTGVLVCSNGWGRRELAGVAN